MADKNMDDLIASESSAQVSYVAAPAKFGRTGRAKKYGKGGSRKDSSYLSPFGSLGGMLGSASNRELKFWSKCKKMLIFIQT